MKSSLFTILAILYAILIVGVIVLFVVYAHPSKHTNNDLQKVYIEAATCVFRELNDMKREWWPTEGTLLGMIRWGDNFGKVHGGTLATDDGRLGAAFACG